MNVSTLIKKKTIRVILDSCKTTHRGRGMSAASQSPNISLLVFLHLLVRDMIEVTIIALNVCELFVWTFGFCRQENNGRHQLLYTFGGQLCDVFLSPVSSLTGFSFVPDRTVFCWKIVATLPHLHWSSSPICTSRHILYNGFRRRNCVLVLPFFKFGRVCVTFVVLYAKPFG